MLVHVILGPSRDHDAKLEPLRENFITLSFKLPRPNLHRNDGCEQPD